MTKPKSARDVYETNVAEWKRSGPKVLEADDLLPGYPDGAQSLHPQEVEMFGIDAALRWELYEAWSWYSGAIAMMDDNDYAPHRQEGRKRFPHLAKSAEAARPIMFDRNDCAAFMHDAAGLPMRQCWAWISKIEAAELRDHVYNKFRDGS